MWVEETVVSFAFVIALLHAVFCASKHNTLLSKVVVLVSILYVINAYCARKVAHKQTCI